MVEENSIFNQSELLTWLERLVSDSDIPELGNQVKLIHDACLQHAELQTKYHNLAAEHKSIETDRNYLAVVFKYSPAPLATLDQLGRILDINHCACDLLRTPPEDLIGKSLADFLPESERLSLESFIKTQINNPNSATPLLLTLIKNNHVSIPIELRGIATHAYEENNIALGIHLNRALDQREENQTHYPDIKNLSTNSDSLVATLSNQSVEPGLTLEEKFKQALTVFYTTQDGVIITDADFNILAINVAFTDITGFTESNIISKPLHTIEANTDELYVHKMLCGNIKHNDHWQGDVWLRRKNGELFVAWENICPIRNRAKVISNYVIVFSDTSTLPKSKKSIQRHSHYDALTGLPNRLLFSFKLENTICHVKRRHGRFALLFLNIDYLQVINRQHGYRYGDEVLRHVTSVLLSTVRSEDVVSRVSGDNFAIILNEIASPEDAAFLSDKIISRISLPCTIIDKQLTVSCSAGISVFPDDDVNQNQLLHYAKTAMEEAKLSGKHTYRFHNTEFTDRAYTYLSFESELRSAIRNHELRVYFQPIISLSTGRISALESLLRWEHAEMGLIRPDEFIAVASDLNVICDVGQWLIDEAMRQTKDYTELDDAVALYIKISDRQILNNQLLNHLRAQLKNRDTQHPQRPIRLAIKEAALKNICHKTEMFDAFRQLQVNICVDDFSLAYLGSAQLSRLPIQSVKISKQLTRHICTDKQSQLIAKAVVAMAESMGFKVIANGVESPEQLKFLLDLGCQYAQGFYFGKPFASNHLQKYLAMETASSPILDPMRIQNQERATEHGHDDRPYST